MDLIPSYMLRDTPTGASTCSLLSLGDFVLQAANPWHVGKWGRSRRVQNNTEIPLLYHKNKMLVKLFFFFTMAQQPVVRQGLLLIEDSPSHSFRSTTVGKTPLDEWSARRTDHYLTTHNTHKSLTTMSSEGFEPVIPASERRRPTH